MKFEIDLNKMEMLSFKGKNPNNDDPEKYAKTYECWRANWEHAFQVELGETGFLPSDQFTRQDEIVTLFYDGECAGIGFLNWAKSDDFWLKHDSYFKNWPELALKKLCSYGENVAVASYFTVDFKFRKNYLGVPWKDFFMAKRKIIRLVFSTNLLLCSSFD